LRDSALASHCCGCSASSWFGDFVSTEDTKQSDKFEVAARAVRTVLLERRPTAEEVAKAIG